MFSLTDDAHAHCCERLAERVLGVAAGSHREAEALLGHVVGLLNASVPDYWALTRNSPDFIVRVTEPSHHGRALNDFLLVGRTHRGKDLEPDRLHHLFTTVLTPTQLTLEGRRPLNELLGVYFPAEFGRAIANRPNLYVFLGKPPYRRYRTWARQQIYVKPITLEALGHALDPRTPSRLRDLFEVHEISPVTPHGLLSDVSRFVRLSFDGTIQPVSRVPEGMRPSFYFQFPPVDPRHLSQVRLNAELWTFHDESAVERVRKFRGEGKFLDRIRSHLESQQGSGVRLEGALLSIGAPCDLDQLDRYYDTPTQDFRALGGILRVRQSSGTTLLTVKLSVSTITPARLEWQMVLPAHVELHGPREQQLRDALAACVVDTEPSHAGAPYHDALRSLADSKAPLIEILSLAKQSTVFPLSIPGEGDPCLISLDTVAILRADQRVASFDEVEIQCRGGFPQPLWNHIAETLRKDLRLQELYWSSKYERALSLILNL